MLRLWGNAARRGALHLQAASCKLCERSRQGRAAVVASASSSGGGSSFQEPWKRFTTSTVISKSTLNRLKVAELREVLQERGLSTDGLKMDLVERMHAVLHEQENEASPAAPAEAELAASTARAGEPASSNSYDASVNGSLQTALRSTITESASDARTPVGPSSNSRATEDVQLRAGASNGAAASSAGSEVHASGHASTTASSHNAGPTAVSARSGNLQATEGARSGAADLSAAARVGTAPDQAAAKTGMAVTWLGTSSGAPTLKRNVSCISLRLPHSTFLVDAGEGSCRQLEMAGMDAVRVKKLFITHMHGDHCFGIGGLLRAVSAAREGTPSADVPFTVYGPPGLHKLVTAALGFDERPLAMPLMVVELTVDPAKGHAPRPAGEISHVDQGRVKFATLAPDRTPDAEAALRRAPDQRRRSNRQMSVEHAVEVIEGLAWTIPCEDGITVTAAQLQHRVPCWGYVFQEAGLPPVPDQALMASAGVDEEAVREAMRQGPSAPVALPGGQAVPVRSLVRPPRRGRKVVLLGDTCNSRAILRVGQGADLLSHEATFTADMREKAHIAQHSTAPMAGAFARALGAQTLVLTHFSGRFNDWRGKPGAGEEDALPSDIQMLRRQAMTAYGSSSIYMAQDFYTHHVPLPVPGAASKRTQAPQGAAKQPQRQQRVAA